MEGKQPIYIYIYIYIYIEALNFDLKFFSFFTEESSKHGQSLSKHEIRDRDPTLLMGKMKARSWTTD
jgi:hypothetical protein